MTTAVPLTPREAGLAALARPFMLLAAVAFVVGFLGYVALYAPASEASDSTVAATAAEPVAAAPASDDWNLPKHI